MLNSPAQLANLDIMGYNNQKQVGLTFDLGSNQRNSFSDILTIVQAEPQKPQYTERDQTTIDSSKPVDRKHSLDSGESNTQAESVEPTIVKLDKETITDIATLAKMNLFKETANITDLEKYKEEQEDEELDIATLTASDKLLSMPSTVQENDSQEQVTNSNVVVAAPEIDKDQETRHAESDLDNNSPEITTGNHNTQMIEGDNELIDASYISDNNAIFNVSTALQPQKEQPIIRENSEPKIEADDSLSNLSQDLINTNKTLPTAENNLEATSEVEVNSIVAPSKEIPQINTKNTDLGSNQKSKIETPEEFKHIKSAEFTPRIAVQEIEGMDQPKLEQQELPSEEIKVEEQNNVETDSELLHTTASISSTTPTKLSNIDHHKMISGLTDDIHTTILSRKDSHVSRLTFMLTPESLGEVEVQVMFTPEGRVRSIQLLVDNQQAKDAIAASLNELKEALKTVVDISGAELSCDLRKGNESNQDAQKQHREIIQDMLDAKSESAEKRVAKDIMTNYTILGLEGTPLSNAGRVDHTI